MSLSPVLQEPVTNVPDENVGYVLLKLQPCSLQYSQYQGLVSALSEITSVTTEK